MIRAYATVLLGTLLLVACVQTPPRPAGEPVAVQLGPVIRLLDGPTSSERVKAVIDTAGHAHVFIASSKDETLRHVVVDPAGTVALNELVRANVKATSLDATIDAAGQLHVLAGALHLVHETSGAWADAPTPWAAAGLETATTRFVHGATADRPLLYAFDVRGKAVGAPARWDLYGLGGYGAGIIWPWRTRGSRLALVAEDGGRYESWWVVDLDDNEDVVDWTTTAEPDGRVHVVYDAQRNILAVQQQARHAAFVLAATDDASTVREVAGRRVRPVSGALLPTTLEQPAVGADAALGFDAATQDLVLVRAHFGARVYRDGAWGPYVPYPLELAWGPRIAPAVRGRFDVVVSGSHVDSPSEHPYPVFYLQFRDGCWSRPVEVAGAEVDSFFGSVWAAVQMASDRHNRVFVTWPVPTGIEARWLTLQAE